MTERKVMIDEIPKDRIGYPIYTRNFSKALLDNVVHVASMESSTSPVIAAL